MSVHCANSVVFGGVTNEAVVSSPTAEDWQLMNFAPLEWTLIGEENHWLRISIKNIEIPDERNENYMDIEQRDTLKGLVVNNLISLINFTTSYICNVYIVSVQISGMGYLRF